MWRDGSNLKFAFTFFAIFWNAKMVDELHTQLRFIIKCHKYDSFIKKLIRVNFKDN